MGIERSLGNGELGFLKLGEQGFGVFKVGERGIGGDLGTGYSDFHYLGTGIFFNRAVYLCSAEDRAACCPAQRDQGTISSKTMVSISLLHSQIAARKSSGRITHGRLGHLGQFICIYIIKSNRRITNTSSHTPLQLERNQ